MTIFQAGPKTPSTTTGSTSPAGQNRTDGLRPPQKGRISWIVAGSLVTGGLAALLLALSPFVPANESSVTGALLLGFALGWAMLAVLSVRFTDQPQKWAAAPAIFMGLAGSLLLVFGSPMHELLTSVWPAAFLVLAIWMTFQVNRQLRSRSGRFLLYPVMAGLVLASLGGGTEIVREVADGDARPTQGQLIDVGGHRLYLNCTGSGSPTVVLEPGGGLMSSDLGLVAPAVASDTRVCVYDRAGRGWSDPASTVQDGAQIATDLRTLLQRGGVPGPYVLAGHSFGGLYALTFAAKFPGDVAGLVMVDSTAPAEEQTAYAGSDDTSRASALAAGASRLGTGWLVGVTPGHLRSSLDEYINAGSSARQAAGLRSFSDKPLVVLTAGTGKRPGWDASQRALATLSTNSLRRVIDGSTHGSLLGDQDDAAATARGILDVVASVRSASPLMP